MPDLPNRRDREAELAVAIWLIFRRLRSLPLDETGLVRSLTTAMTPPLIDTYVAAARNLPLPAGASEMIEESAMSWANNYAPALAAEVVDSTVHRIDPSQGPNQLETILSRQRAEDIAVTETTRAITAAEAWVVLWMAQEDGQQPEKIWQTEHDAKVCPVCRPLHNQNETVWRQTSPGGPPAHPRCRCWLKYRRSA